MSDQNAKLVTLEVYAVKHGVSINCVRLWIKFGRLQKYACGSRVLVNENEPRPQKGSRWHGAKIKTKKS